MSLQFFHSQNLQLLQAETLAYVAATQLSNSTLIYNLDVYIKGLKDDGIWNDIKVLYPFISDGINQSHSYQRKFNLKDPRDLDAAFRLVFSGTESHTSQGTSISGGYGETFYVPATNNTVSNMCLSAGTNDVLNEAPLFGNTIYNEFYLTTNTSGNVYCSLGGYGTILSPNTPATSQFRDFVVSRNSGTTARVYADAISANVAGFRDLTYTANDVNNWSIILWGHKHWNGTIPRYSSGRLKHFMIGNSMNDTKMVQYLSRTKTFMATQGR